MAQDEIDEDSVTETDVDLDPSLIAEITITRSGDAPITVSVGSASAPASSPADSEPRTLEPQLVVRGLGPVLGQAIPGSVEAPASSALGMGEEEDDKTTRSIDARLVDAYDAARRTGAVSTQPSPTQLSPTQPSPVHTSPTRPSALITPSEPFRVTPQSPDMPLSVAIATLRRAAPIPAAGRPPERELDAEVVEPTAKRAPLTIDDEDVEDAEDETRTDAMRSVIVDTDFGPAADLETAPLPPLEEPDDETKTNVGHGLRAVGGGVMGSLPGATRSLVGLEEARIAANEAVGLGPSTTPLAKPAASDARNVVTPGATIRMMFNASLGAAEILKAARADPERASAPPPPTPLMQLPTPPPPAQRAALTATPMPTAAVVAGLAPGAGLLHVPTPVDAIPPAAQPTARRPPTPFFDPLAKPKRKRGRKLFFFVVFVAASGAGFHFRHRAMPWVMKHLPASVRRFVVPAPPPPSPAPVVVPTASAAPDPSAMASASAPPSASAAPSAAPSATPSGSAAPSSSAHGKKRPKR